MTARLLDGRAVAREIRGEVGTALAAFRAAGGSQPHLVVVQVGDDSAATAYVRSIVRGCASAEMACTVEALPGDAGQDAVLALIGRLSDDAAVHGILIQAPLPAPLTLAEAAAAMDPRKDVDGAHPLNLGHLAEGRPTIAPCTPVGGVELLQRLGLSIAGQRAVVVGRGVTVGRPLALLLLGLDATVTICHSRTPDLGAVTQQADLLAVATGRAGLVRPDMIRPGATVLDFGVNEVDGRLVGDVTFEGASEVAGAITPVPGGTGPMTNAILLRHLLDAARRLHR